MEVNGSKNAGKHIPKEMCIMNQQHENDVCDTLSLLTIAISGIIRASQVKLSRFSLL